MEKHPNFYRTMLINEWFETKTKKYRYEQNRKVADVYVVVKSPPLLATFKKVYKHCMRSYPSYWDCINHCLSLVWDGLLRFKTDGTSWEKIATHEDMDAYKQLIVYLQKHILNTARKENIGYRHTTKTITTEDGTTNKVSIFYKVTATTINQMMESEDGNESELSEIVEESYWNSNTDYHKNNFTSWFEANKHNILTEHQVNIFNELADDTNYNKVEDEAYFYTTEKKRSALSMILSRMTDNVERAYEESHKSDFGNYITSMIDEELALLNNFAELVENGATDSELTMAIVNHLDYYCWDKIVYDEISLDAQKDVIRTYNANVIQERNFKFYIGKEMLSHNTLYEIINAVAVRIVFLEDSYAYEMKLAKDKAEADSKRKPRKRELEIPEGVKSIYVNVDTNGNWISD